MLSRLELRKAALAPSAMRGNVLRGLALVDDPRSAGPIRRPWRCLGTPVALGGTSAVSSLLILSRKASMLALLRKSTVSPPPLMIEKGKRFRVNIFSRGWFRAAALVPEKEGAIPCPVFTAH
jgi:hypothetical protein